MKARQSSQNEEQTLSKHYENLIERERMLLNSEMDHKIDPRGTPTGHLIVEARAATPPEVANKKEIDHEVEIHRGAKELKVAQPTSIQMPKTKGNDPKSTNTKIKYWWIDLPKLVKYVRLRLIT